MSKQKKKSNNQNELNNLFSNISDAARAALISSIMESYIDRCSTISISPSEHLLSTLLGVSPDWIVFFDGTFSSNGRIHGPMLWGAEDHPAVVLSHALLEKKYGFVQHPLVKDKMFCHPFIKSQIEAGWIKKEDIAKNLSLYQRIEKCISGMIKKFNGKIFHS